MTAAENSLIANVDKIAYTSYFDSDKVAEFSTPDDSSGIGRNAQFICTAAIGLPFVSQTLASTSNPYGRRCLMTMSWSLDQLNWYPANVPVFYYNATYLSYFWQALVFCYCSDTTIYFGANTQYTSDQIIYLQFALDTPT